MISEDKFDPDLLREFMLGGTPSKDDARRKKSSGSIDLHLHESPGKHSSTNQNKLERQLAHLEKQLDTALASGCLKLEVIHGKGDWKLKDAVHAFLKRHPHVKSFRLMEDKLHDGGATEVFFK